MGRGWEVAKSTLPPPLQPSTSPLSGNLHQTKGNVGVGVCWGMLCPKNVQSSFAFLYSFAIKLKKYDNIGCVITTQYILYM